MDRPATNINKMDGFMINKVENDRVLQRDFRSNSRVETSARPVIPGSQKPTGVKQ